MIIENIKVLQLTMAIFAEILIVSWFIWITATVYKLNKKAKNNKGRNE